MQRKYKDVDKIELIEFEDLLYKVTHISVTKKNTMSFYIRLSTLTFKMLNIFICKFIIRIFVTTQVLHLDDLFFDDPSIMTGWDDMNRQSIWKEILMDDGRMNSEGEVYYLYDHSPQNERENKD